MLSEERDEEYEERLGTNRTTEGCGERDAPSSEACSSAMLSSAP